MLYIIWTVNQYCFTSTVESTLNIGDRISHWLDGMSMLGPISLGMSWRARPPVGRAKG